MRWQIIWLSLLLLGSNALAQNPPGNTETIPPYDVILPDQFERNHQISTWRGNVVVLVFGDRQGAEAGKKLGRDIHVTFHPGAAGKSPAEAQKCPVRPLPRELAGSPQPDVKVIPIACTGKVPALLQGFILKQFRKAVPDVPVLLDMEDAMKSAFGVVPGVANLVVLDAAGRPRYRMTGNMDGRQMAALENALDELRREAVLGKTSHRGN